MEIYYVFGIVGVISLLYFFIERRLRISEKGFSEGDSRQLLDMVDKLRQDIRYEFDKNSDYMQARLSETVNNLQGEFRDVRKTVDSRLSENTKALNDRLDNASQVFQKLGQEMGKMNQMGEQIKKLHQVLGGQKLRGNLGEQIMNELIAQIIPFSEYTFQYQFQGGETVDAVIKTQNGYIPIDSKFPLENYQRIVEAEDDAQREFAQREFIKNVKKHISDIHKKYIRPEQGTVDFALMYVPADSIYFEIIVNSPELNSFAQEKKVYVVSPSVFYSFLQIVLMSYQSQKFEEHAKSVLNLIRGVRQESEKFGKNIDVLAKHVNNAKVKMDEVYHGYDKLDLKIQQVSSYEGSKSLESAKKEPLKLDSEVLETLS